MKLPNFYGNVIFVFLFYCKLITHIFLRSMGNYMLRKNTIAVFFISIFSLSITACSTVAPSQGYRPSGSTAAPWQISGELFDFTNVKIFINGTTVIDKRISLMSGEGEFNSTYNGKQIMASCSTSSGLMSTSTKCIVFVENEKAATLSF